MLGIPPSASTDAVREAYRDLAREHHPDRVNSAAGGRSMPEINEAYRILQDPARRAVYDASLRSTGAVPTAPTAATADTPAPAPIDRAFHDFSPARVPWRPLLFVAVIGVIGVVVLAQFTEPARAPGPDGILRIGDCVEIDANGFAREVMCTGDVTADLVVEDFVPFDVDCPVGTVLHQDRQGMGNACVGVPPPAAPGS